MPYVPGDLTEKHHQLPSHEELAADRFSKENSPSSGLPNIRDDFSKPLPETKRDLTEEVNDFYKSHKEMVLSECHRKLTGKTNKDRILSPILAAISNFSLAKKLHKENLEHNPLPDTISDSMYQKMQMQQRAGEPGLMLEDDHFATGVGWKGYPGYGPTRCTKLKIYRPKTCGRMKEEDTSISSFDKKWRFLRQSKVTPMDLAICWDMTPEDPKDEPQRSAHIDGSNGSAAPAVFNLVHTPKEEEVERKCDGIHGCGPLFDHSNKGSEEKDYIFHRSKNNPPSLDSNKSETSSRKKRAQSANEVEKQSAISKASSSSNKSRAKSAYNLNESEHSHSSKETNNNSICNKLRHSTPNLGEHDQCGEQNCKKYLSRLPNNKFCVACEMKNMSIKEKRPKSEYKMAFKAGVPRKIKSKREDYPEHWRLATVYQHSYKPIQYRKRPMLQTVFK
ncbi:uncharacterized protein [Leptinotarsa decemlineata]|uniref:uncharacterized protein n=1 Tax=Leptinotarsa decemlineata TaxID=7539 RepID=UPI003D30B688